MTFNLNLGLTSLASLILLVLCALFTTPTAALSASTTTEELSTAHKVAKRDLALDDYHLIIILTMEMWVIVLVGGLFGMWLLRKVLRLEGRIYSL